MTPAIYRAMCKRALQVITVDWRLPLERVRLVSGGSAWSDHVAVDLFLQHARDTGAADAKSASFEGLTLYLPCAIASDQPQFVDTADRKWQTSPGRTLNALHAQFAKKMGRDGPSATIEDLLAAQRNGAVLHVGSDRGFHARNTRVAKSQYVLALTWSANAKRPTGGGGTADTWKKAVASGTKSSNMCHISLSGL
jgi:hypothetical protein